MARAAIEATAKGKSVTGRSLADKIDKMYEAQLIRPHVRDGAHEVRYLGNDMAHGDFAEPVAAADADLVLALMSEVLEDVYQSPARVARAQAMRERRQTLEATRTASVEGITLPTGGSPTAEAIIQALVIQARRPPPTAVQPDPRQPGPNS